MTASVTAPNIGRTVAVTGSAVIVDAQAYYRAFYAAARLARRSILLAGWQFDTEAVLLRGNDAREADLPVKLLPFLSALCERTPELQIHVLAWDYSVAYAFEREWLQDWKFSLDAHERIHFEFDRHPRPTGSRHEKYVVIDGSLAFAGGADICDERWDDREHSPDNPLRRNVAGERSRPNHEVQSLVTGPAAALLAELFRERWREMRGEALDLPAKTADLDLDLVRRGIAPGGFLPLDASSVRVCRTWTRADDEVEREILCAFSAWFAAAERVIYIETQYFTSRSVVLAMLERLNDESKPKLELLVVLPTRADSSKEEFAMGETQRMVLGALEQAAREKGHELRFLCSVCDPETGDTTFIHSKVLIVDDRFLSVGSANFTERSMGFDSELSLMWEAVENPALERDIRRVRASLLAEHASLDAAPVDQSTGLVSVVDRWVSEGESRLRACHFERVEANVTKTRFFDPGGPASLSEEAEPTPLEELERFARGTGRIVRELSERLLSKS